jgi:hypothetical protein
LREREQLRPRNYHPKVIVIEQWERPQRIVIVTRRSLSIVSMLNLLETPPSVMSLDSSFALPL